LKNVLLQRVLAEGEKELLTPSGVAARGNVEDDGDETPDALHGNGLGVQIEDGSGLMEKQGTLEIAGGGGGGQRRVSGDGVDIGGGVSGSLTLAGGAI
jgi:hypothetical protein